MIIGLPFGSMPVTTPTWPPFFPRASTAMAPTCGEEMRWPYWAKERAASEFVPAYPLLRRTKFMKVAHHSLVRAVGLVPMYLRASRTKTGQPLRGCASGPVTGLLVSRSAAALSREMSFCLFRGARVASWAGLSCAGLSCADLGGCSPARKVCGFAAAARPYAGRLSDRKPTQPAAKAIRNCKRIVFPCHHFHADRFWHRPPLQVARQFSANRRNWIHDEMVYGATHRVTLMAARARKKRPRSAGGGARIFTTPKNQLPGTT